DVHAEALRAALRAGDPALETGHVGGEPRPRSPRARLEPVAQLELLDDEVQGEVVADEGQPRAGPGQDRVEDPSARRRRLDPGRPPALVRAPGSRSRWGGSAASNRRRGLP